MPGGRLGVDADLDADFPRDEHDVQPCAVEPCRRSGGEAWRIEVAENSKGGAAREEGQEHLRSSECKATRTSPVPRELRRHRSGAAPFLWL